MNEVVYTPLHQHTYYSLKDACCSPKELAETLQAKGIKACAVTEHGNLFSVQECYDELTKRGIKFIPGIECYVAEHGHTRFERPQKKTKKQEKTKEDYNESSDMNYNYCHLILLAMNKTGYLNLIKLASIGYDDDSYYYKPRIDFDLLKQHSEGLICTSACLAGNVSRLIVEGEYEKAKSVAKDYLDLFGPDRYYLELQQHGIPEEDIMNAGLVKISEELGINLIVTNDSHSATFEDAQPLGKHDVLVTASYKQNISDPKRTWLGAYFNGNSGEHYIKGQNEMEKLPIVQAHPESILNTKKIADMCSFDLSEMFAKPTDNPSGMHIPLINFDSSTFSSDKDYFRHVVYEALNKKFNNNPPQNYIDRVEYELGIIQSQGFSSYMLTQQNFIKITEDAGIVHGPGRGSIAGCLIAYLLDITTMDPLVYDLYMERFLAPEARASLPDIDIDYADKNAAFEAIKEAYGEDKVAHVMNITYLKARSSLQEVARILEYTPKESDEISKLIPEGNPNITLKEALESQEIKHRYEHDEKFRRLYDMAMNIEGLAYSTGVHASATIVADKPIAENYCQTMKIEKSKIKCIGLQGTEAERNWIIKFDILGLSNLNFIEETKRLIKLTNQHNQGDLLDLEALDIYDYPEVYDVARTDTLGVFQFESAGMSGLLKDGLYDFDSKMKSIKTDEDRRKIGEEFFNRAAAITALYRPGASQFIPTWVSGLKNPSSVKYMSDVFKEITEDTYGSLIYQEQIMRLFQKFANFSLGESDTIRKGIAKKKVELVESAKEKFYQGALDNGYDRKLIDETWDIIEHASSYSFNKSHAFSYTKISMFDLYLRYYYEPHFMCSILSNTEGDELKKYISACQNKLDLKISHPDINDSEGNFTLKVIDYNKPLTLPNGRSNKDNFEIIFGLNGIKGLSEKTVTPILEERAKNGDFKSYRDFIERCESFVNISNLKNMIFAGCFDSFDKNRQQLSINAEKLLNNIKEDKKRKAKLAEREAKERALAEEEGREPNEKKWAPRWKNELDWNEEKVSMFTNEEKAFKEKEVTGTFFEYNPISQYEDVYNKLNGKAYKLADLVAEGCKVQKALVVGVFSTVKKKVSKNSGKPFVELSLSDDTFEIPAFAYENTLENFESSIMNESAVHAVVIRTRRDNDGTAGRWNIEQVYTPSDPNLASEVLNNWNVFRGKNQQNFASEQKFNPNEVEFPLGVHINIEKATTDRINEIVNYLNENLKPGKTELFINYVPVIKQKPEQEINSLVILTGVKLNYLIKEQELELLKKYFGEDNVYWQKHEEIQYDLDPENTNLLTENENGDIIW